MLGVFPILLFCTYIAMEDVIWAPIRSRAAKKDEHTEKVDKQIKKLWQVAQDSMKTKKPLRAEKALLSILKFDQKNAAAYNDALLMREVLTNVFTLSTYQPK